MSKARCLLPTSFVLALALGCAPDEVATKDTLGSTDGGHLTDPERDQDGDGFVGTSWGGDDCNDLNASVHPDAIEVCNNKDDDCDGTADVNAVDMPEWYRDEDGDGHGVGGETLAACDRPAGYAALDDDCDDSERTTHPNAIEVCDDGIDNNCDGDQSLCSTIERYDIGEASVRIAGAEESDHAGSQVAMVGDVTGDGLPDLAVGATYLKTADYPAGQTFLFSGPVEGDVGTGAADAVVRGAAEGDLAGWAFAGVGDVNGDSVDDLVMGAWGADGDDENGWVGAAYLLHGPLTGDVSLDAAGAGWHGQATGDYAGSAVARLGDQDGDGVAELLVAAWAADSGDVLNAGAVWVVDPSAEGDWMLNKQAIRWDGPGEGAVAGTALATGDWNGDGVEDVAVGAPGARGLNGGKLGAAFVLLGPVDQGGNLADADAAIWGRDTNDQAGAALVGHADLTGDGIDDLMVGVPNRSVPRAGGGAVFMVAGASEGLAGMLDTHAELVPHTSYGQLGSSLAMVGDVDGDGLQDAAVGAPHEGTGGPNAGAAYVVFGPLTGAMDLTYGEMELVGEAEDDNAGHAMAGVGDMDGDGADDLAVGAPSADILADQGGAVYIWMDLGR